MHRLGSATGEPLLATVTAVTDLPPGRRRAGPAAALAAAAALVVARVDVPEPDPAAVRARDDRA